MFFRSGVTNRKNLNFSEYQFKENYNRCCNFPNFSKAETFLNNNIMFNSDKALVGVEKQDGS